MGARPLPEDIRLVNEDLVLVRTSPLWSQIAFSLASGVKAPVVVEVLAHQSRDKPFFGLVLDQGVGIEQYGKWPAMVAKVGDTVVFNDNTLSYRVHEQGAVRYLVRNSAIAALMSTETFELTPAQHYILVRANEAAALPLIRENVDSRLWLPTEDMETDDEGSRFNTGLRAEYGEVIACGPGRWHEGSWQAPRCAPGDMILFDSSHSTLNVTIRGARYTLVACTQVAITYRGAALGYQAASPTVSMTAPSSSGQ